MRSRTKVVIAVLLLTFAGGGAYALVQTSGIQGQLNERWVSDTARETIGNHHVPATTRIKGDMLITIPVNAPQDVGPCSLVAVNQNATRQWRDGMPTKACNIHGYGDPIFADYDSDGTTEALVATTEEAIVGLNPQTGEEEFRHKLSWWGYAAPIVTDFAPTPGKEIVVVDLSGGTFVLAPNGTVVWQVDLSGVVAPPAIKDFDADGMPELVVGEGQNVTWIDRSGDIAQRTDVGATVNWMTTRQADDDPAIEIVAATIDGRVVALDGRTGKTEWKKKFGTLAAVEAFGDGDSDGQAEVYAVAQDGKLRAINASDGTIEWTTTLTAADVQMTPPPVLGNLDGDEDLELVAVSQDGVVSVVNPKTGEITASYKRDVPIWTYPALADLDGDGNKEILVIYGDGRVAALTFET